MTQCTEFISDQYISGFCTPMIARYAANAKSADWSYKGIGS